MNWPVVASMIGSFLAFAGYTLWRVAVFFAKATNADERCHERLVKLETYQQRTSDWKHDRVNPLLQILYQDYELRREREGRALRSHPSLPSWAEFEEDSRVTDDPRKEKK